MPKLGNQVVCVTHTTTNMIEQPGFHAVTVVQKVGQQIQFNPASGIPLKIYVCPQCGYVESYFTGAIPDWNN